MTKARATSRATLRLIANNLPALKQRYDPLVVSPTTAMGRALPADTKSRSNGSKVTPFGYNRNKIILPLLHLVWAWS